MLLGHTALMLERSPMDGRSFDSLARTAVGGRGTRRAALLTALAAVGIGQSPHDAAAGVCQRHCRDKSNRKAHRRCIRRCRQRQELGGCNKLDQLCGSWAGPCCQGRCIGRFLSTCQHQCDSDRECRDAYPDYGSLVLCAADTKCNALGKCCVNHPCWGVSYCPDPKGDDQQCCNVDGAYGGAGVCCFPGQTCIGTQGCFWL